ncbi:MAG: hypothetical protein LUH47_10355 [Clostridiales bacterium]|nr:hypothetical protein [Clostridiales bacterium]
MTFLKISGCVIIIIIAAAVLIIGALLADPFCLCAKGSLGSKNEGEFSLRWLFGLVRLKGSFKEGRLDYSLTYPFKAFLSKPKKKKPKKTEKKPSKTENKQSVKQVTPNSQAVSPDKKDTNKNVTAKTETKTESKAQQTKQKPKSRISILRERISEIMAYENKGDIINCFVKNIKYMLCKLKFEIFEVNVLFGFDNPSLTGEILGLLYASSTALKKGVNIEADFNKQIVEGEGNIKCRGNLFNIVFPTARFILNKNVRNVLF